MSRLPYISESSYAMSPFEKPANIAPDAIAASSAATKRFATNGVPAGSPSQLIRGRPRGAGTSGESTASSVMMSGLKGNNRRDVRQQGGASATDL